MDVDEMVMNIIVNSGSARSFAIEALRAAKEGNFEEAEKLMSEADSTILESHESQTKMIQAEINGEKMDISLLVVHSQDHLMNAMTVIDLCKEMIDILKAK